MNMRNLAGKIAIGSEIRGTASKDCLIAAGPLTKQPGTMPYRVVLVVKGDEFIVYDEIFDTEGLPSPSYSHDVLDDIPESRFENGSYFYGDQFAEAVVRFATRLADHSGSLRSLYREAPHDVQRLVAGT